MGDALFLVIGFLIGMASGILPGLHPNTLISILASLGLDDRSMALLIISLYPASLISSFIPAIFFGIPEAGTVLATLPGHRMVLKGEGMAALKTVLLSSLLAALLAAALFELSLDFFQLAYGMMKSNMGWLLLGLSLVLLTRAKKPHLSAGIFVISGLLGHYSLNSGMRDPFLPLFCGMFALAAMATYGKNEIPEQKDGKIGLGFVRFAVVGVVLGMLADLIPGIGSPSQVATFATMMMPVDTLGYLAAISAISVSQSIFSLSTSIAIDKSRVGATAWLSGFMDIGENAALLLPLFIISMALAVLVVYMLRKRIAGIASMDFSRMNIVLALYLGAVTFVLDGFTGLVVLVVAAALGWLTIRLGVERTALMGSIIVPTLLLLFRIFF
ncbi:tripartite tricarboxylate transporter permease [Candidatus Micrarchaeota archaeon]|nr:tripartite tricarboxylate transporter permease [Candidatus Micrarchaeota archaeon]